MNENTGEPESYWDFQSKYYINGHSQTPNSLDYSTFFTAKMKKVRLIWINKSDQKAIDLQHSATFKVDQLTDAEV